MSSAGAGRDERPPGAADETRDGAQTARLDAVAGFLSSLWAWADGDGDERLAGHLVTVVTIDPREGEQSLVRTSWIPADDPGAVARAVVDADVRSAAVYLSTTATDASGKAASRTERGGYRRPKAEHTTALVAVWADIDIASGVHNDERSYPPDLDAAWSIITASGARPSVVVDSGHGLHAYWRLAEPWVLDGEDEHAEATTLVRDWVSSLRAHAHRLGGWEIDPVGDLARILRVPGSTNRKAEPHRPVRVIATDPEATYEPDDLRALMVEDDVLAAYGAPTTSVAELPGVDLQEVWSRVRSQRYVESNYTPEWIDAGYLDHPGNPVEQAWHGEHPSDDPSTVDASLVRTVLDHGATLAQACEVVMCYRLRTGHKIEKVDPRSRTSYLVTTVAKIAALAQDARAKREQTGAKRAALDEADAALRDPTPAAPPPPRATEPDEAETEVSDAVAEIALADMAHPSPTLAPVDDPTQERHYVTDLADPWGERPLPEVEVLGELSALLLPRPMQERGVKVWRMEYRDYGHKQEARLVLALPADFAWQTGERPGMYHPGRPFPTAWRPRDYYETHKGFHQALRYDARIRPKPIASGNAAPDSGQASAGEWAGVIDALVPFWRRDTSHTDLTSAAYEWLLDYLTEHPPTNEAAEALATQRPLLADSRGWNGEPPVILITAKALLGYIAVQPGTVGGGRHGRQVLEHLRLRPVRPRESASRRVRWLEIEPEQFDAEVWAEITEAAAESMERRAESAAYRKGIRAVGDEERASTATDRMAQRFAVGQSHAPDPEEPEE